MTTQLNKSVASVVLSGAATKTSAGIIEYTCPYYPHSNVAGKRCLMKLQSAAVDSTSMNSKASYITLNMSQPYGYSSSVQNVSGDETTLTLSISNDQINFNEYEQTNIIPRGIYNIYQLLLVLETFYTTPTFTCTVEETTSSYSLTLQYANSVYNSVYKFSSNSIELLQMLNINATTNSTIFTGSFVVIGEAPMTAIFDNRPVTNTTNNLFPQVIGMYTPSASSGYLHQPLEPWQTVVNVPQSPTDLTVRLVCTDPAGYGSVTDTCTQATIAFELIPLE